MEAVIHTASLDEVILSAWCRENGVYPAKMELSRAQVSDSLSDVASASSGSTAERKSRKEIRKLQRDLARKEKVLAETDALLVISKSFRQSSTRAGTNDVPGRSQGIMDAVAEARRRGAHQSAVCEIIGVDPRTLRRWSTAEALRDGDRRPLADRPTPATRLSEAEYENRSQSGPARARYWRLRLGAKNSLQPRRKIPPLQSSYCHFTLVFYFFSLRLTGQAGLNRTAKPPPAMAPHLLVPILY